MANLGARQSWIQAVARLTGSLALVLALAAASVAEAQTYNVIYSFGGCSDGNTPTSTLTLDRSGNLYGTTQYGGSACGTNGLGVVFRLKPAGGDWVETPIHIFTGGRDDGANPTNYGGLMIGPDGSFYGTAPVGGRFGEGIVYRLRPSASACRNALCPG